jgi:hypothetical protein
MRRLRDATRAAIAVVDGVGEEEKLGKESFQLCGLLWVQAKMVLRT